MSSTQLPKLLNRAYDEEFAFPQFARLPWELRNQIWVSALQTRRLIRADLQQLEPDSPPGDAQEQEVIRHGLVYLVVSGFQLLPVLLRVNSESRVAAFDFYRMRLPCLLKHPREKNLKPTRGILFFNPEHDILWIDDYHDDSALAQTLQTIIKHDTLGVGLCNMALTALKASHSIQRRNDSDYVAFQSPFGPIQNQASKNIRELYLVQEIQSYRVRAVREQYNDQAWECVPSTTSGRQHPRKAMKQAYTPVASGIPSFSLLPHDPRPIVDDLARLYINDSISQTIVSAWENTFFLAPTPDDPFETAPWGLDSSRVNARVLIMCRNENPMLPVIDSPYDAPSLQRSRLSSSEPQIHKSDSPLTPSISLTMDEETQKQETCSALGFWLFPLRAFASDNMLIHPSGAFSTLTLWDVSNSPPELGLFHLPADTS